MAAGALALAPVAASAQQAPPSTNAPAADAIGPKALQNFTLNGTVTRAADQPVPVKPAPERRAPPAQAKAAPPPATTEAAAPPPVRTTARPSPSSEPVRTVTLERAPPPESAPEPLRQSPPSSSVTVALPKLHGTSAAAIAPPQSFAPAPEPVGNAAARHSIIALPWLLALLALILGGAFLFWRNRSREAFAGGAQANAFAAPEPAPVPRAHPRPPAPAAEPKPPPPSSLGIVSTRLRPWLDIGFQPLRCVLEDERLVVEFDIELFNSGSAPARGVLIEATLFNAGPDQDQQIGGFFANPVAAGERIAAIPPLQRVSVRTQVATPREQVQAYELAGRQVFVPVIAFNALYSWSGGEGQTSVSHLLGRETKGDKMGPFRLDLGPRIFRGVAARLLPGGVRN